QHRPPGPGRGGARDRAAVPGQRAARDPPPGLPRLDRPAPQRDARADQEHDRRGRCQRGHRGLLGAEDDDRVPLQPHLRDLLHLRDRVRHPRDTRRPADHRPLPTTGGAPMTPQQTVLFDASGPRARRLTLIGSLVGAVVALGVVFLLLRAVQAKGQLDPTLWLHAVDANAWTNYYLIGLQRTLEAAGLSIVGALAFGLVFGLGRLAQSRLVR